MSQPNMQKRKRSRVACEPCRERKRKCDGFKPCTTCSDWGYDCYYESQPRHKPRVAQNLLPDPVPRSKSPQQKDAAPDAHGLVRRREANSGAAFVRRMGLKIDPVKAPKLSLFGWNIGKRELSSAFDGINPSLPITEITSLEHMRRLAQVYFEKVDPCYGFIDRRRFFERLETRWQSTLMNDLYDSVLGGVAALGCLFSQRNMTTTELYLTESARSTLETHVLSGVPPVDLLTGWTLRVAYMRMTDSPHSTWIASSTLMHLLEAAGFHLESSTDTVFPRSSTAGCDLDISRRLFGVAQHLNMWTSFDLGLSQVSFREKNMSLAPSTRPGDYTNELLGLLPVSASLDPGKSREDDTDLEATLSEILDGVHSEPPSVMAQCNLVLCIVRRIHTQYHEVFPSLADRVVELLKKGLDNARTLVMTCSPWHHMANVPFHITCVLLVMDTRSSLAIVPEAMQTLKLVASTYDTDTMREAWSAAYLLVMLHQQRRKDDIAIFTEAINIEQEEVENEPFYQETPSAEEYSWLGALVADLPGLQRVDLDQFLTAEMIDNTAFIGGSG